MKRADLKYTRFKEVTNNTIATINQNMKEFRTMLINNKNQITTVRNMTKGKANPKPIKNACNGLQGQINAVQEQINKLASTLFKQSKMKLEMEQFNTQIRTQMTNIEKNVPATLNKQVKKHMKAIETRIYDALRNITQSKVAAQLQNINIAQPTPSPTTIIEEAVNAKINSKIKITMNMLHTKVIQQA
jgi:hypothetical protein